MNGQKTSKTAVRLALIAIVGASQMHLTALAIGPTTKIAVYGSALARVGVRAVPLSSS